MYFDERENILDYSDNNYNLEKYENSYTNNETKKWDNDFKLDVENININNYNRDDELYSDKEGFNKGNMFKSLYKPYKNYIYRVVVNGKKDELLLSIQELTFKIIDLGLYLDIYPNDQKCYEEFKNTVQKLKSLKDEYEKNYGPLCLDNTLYYSEYKWIKNPWPWMNEGGAK